jgi:alpha-L-fucosidase 2
VKYTDSKQIDLLSGVKNDNLLWYNTHAANWLEALPIGNGHLGAMVFGGVAEDHYQLNHDTLYSDEPGRRDLDLDITLELDKVVGLVQAGRFTEADDIVTNSWLGRSWPCYQPMADARLLVGHTSRADRYVRWLDLSTGVHTVSYYVDETRYTRESFASHPDGVLPVRLSASAPGSVSSDFHLSSVHPNSRISIEDGNTIVLSGQAPGFALRRTLDLVEQRNEQWKYPELWDADGNRTPHADVVLYGDDIDNLGMFFEVRMVIRPDGGMTEQDGNVVRVSKADSIELLLAAETSYAGYNKSPSKDGADQSRLAAAAIEGSAEKTHVQLRTRHMSDHGELFDRVALTLKDHPEHSWLPTNQRIETSESGNDPSYRALYYQFARYLAIAGSRPGTQALNLQGIWNEDVIPPWASAYTININIQMNYWPVTTGNLIECEEPLVDLVQELSASGEEVARSMYSRNGWVAHHNTSLWRSAQPVDNIAQTSFWPMGSGWLCRHLWDHYLFTCDAEYLKTTAVPLLKGASLFYLEWLTEDADGHLLSPVGTSPENAFRYADEDQQQIDGSVSSGPTMDMAIIRDCLENTKDALSVTGGDPDFSCRLEEALGRLLPYSVAEDGQLKEWAHEHPGFDPQHRHLSHLYGAFPASQITKSDTPELFEAVGRTLEVRGDESGGWSSAWKANLWARRRDGNRAYRMLTRVASPELTNPNMFNGHRTWQERQGLFQIDGNMGGAAATIEMLVQSEWYPGRGLSETADTPPAATIELLPALPDVWSKGELRGVRCRGGFEVSFAWSDSSIEWAEITSLAGTPLCVRFAEKAVQLRTQVGEMVRLGPALSQE